MRLTCNLFRIYSVISGTIVGLKSEFFFSGCIDLGYYNFKDTCIAIKSLLKSYETELEVYNIIEPKCYNFVTL